MLLEISFSKKKVISTFSGLCEDKDPRLEGEDRYIAMEALCEVMLKVF